MILLHRITIHHLTFTSRKVTWQWKTDRASHYEGGRLSGCGGNLDERGVSGQNPLPGGGVTVLRFATPKLSGIGQFSDSRKGWTSRSLPCQSR